MTAVSSSTGEALFPRAQSVCLMDVEGASFEVAFFGDAGTASVVCVSERPLGDRYIYLVNGQKLDAALRLYWQLSGDALVWTNDASLDRSLTNVLAGTHQPVECAAVTVR